MQTQQLPYSKKQVNRLSEETIKSHHREYQLYIDNLNILISDTIFKNTDLGTLIKISQGPIQFNAVQAWNHIFYFTGLKPGGSRLQKGSLMLALNGCFGSFHYFIESFIKYGTWGEASGWLWLVINSEGSLEIFRDHGSKHPFLKGYWPLFSCDLWEHSFITEFGQDRASYIESVLRMADWEKIEMRYYNGLRQIARPPSQKLKEMQLISI